MRILFLGNLKAELVTAEKSLSLLSFTAVSGNPTIDVKAS